MKLFGLIALTKRLFRAKPREIEMAKADVVAAGVAAIQAGEVQVYSDALGKAYDGGFTDGVASVPPGTGGDPSKIFSQADMDAAKAADAQALAQSQADDKAAFDSAKALSDAAIADLQGKFDQLAVKEGQESGVIAGLQDSLQKIKDAEALLAGLFPAPAPAPVPPVPVPPAPAPAA